jgi:Secretion system C-terminal sorting domain/Polysaccharide deacetylase/PA14 domain
MNHWYKASFKTILSTLPFLATNAFAQTPTVAYAAWKDNAKAAYTLVHDDFGAPQTPGIVNYADTIAYNRGVKFCFGAITGDCDANDWADARRLMSHGHEIINHTHTHRCSYQPGWCEATNLYSVADFPVELDGSTTLIEQGAGERPRFFIHPYDLSTTEVLNRLKSLGYLGARSGTQGILNQVNFTDFFNLNFFVHDPTSNLTLLNDAVQQAVAAGGYAMRELHGVGDASWASVPVADYRAHMDFVKGHIAAGNIWSATASEAITYKIQKDAYIPSVVYDATAKTLTVNFTGAASISPNLFKTPVTINVNLNGLVLAGNLTVKQGTETLVAKVSNTQITVNAYPNKGSIVISVPTVVGCAPNCPPPPPVTCTPDGKLKADSWTGLTLNNWTLTDLTTNPRFPNTPNKTELLIFSGFSKGDAGDMYGEKTYGYIVAPKDGNYTFAVTGDDDVELYLSTDDKPANKRKIAGFSGFTTIQQFTKYAGQKSASIALKANQFYYVELLHLGTVGTNRYDVFWQLPGTTAFSLITKANLASQTCAVATSALVTLNGTRAGQTTLLNWATQQVAEKTPYTVERLEGNGRFAAIGTAQGNDFADESPINGINIYRIQYKDSYGQTQHSEPVKINFAENPNVYLAPNPAENVVSVDLREWNQAAVTLYIYDVRGAEMQRVQTTASDVPYQLDLSQIAQTGQYMIRVQGANGHAATKRLMIKR